MATDWNVISARRTGAARSFIGIRASKHRAPASRLWLAGISWMAMAVPFAPVFGAARTAPLTLLAGYKAVRVHYGAVNKMLMQATINGQAATLIVDTGARQIILDSGSAQSLGITPSRFGLRYVSSTEINGQSVPIGFARNVTVGTMNFGGTPVALLETSRGNNFSGGSGMRGANIAGVLGTDLLTRYKAVINCGTRLIFFKVDPSRKLQLAHTASSQGFTKVPMVRHGNGAFTVPCSINGHSGSLLVDTGAFVTTLDESTLKAIGISLQPTQAKARFTTGLMRTISLGEVNHLTIGDFKVRPMRLAAAVLPAFALRQGDAKIYGILGLELLVFCHAIIDFDSMSLFLK